MFQSRKVISKNLRNHRTKKHFLMHCGLYVFDHVLPIGAVNQVDPQRVQCALTNRRRWMSQIIDQLRHHRLHDLVNDIDVQRRQNVHQHPQGVLAHFPFRISQSLGDFDEGGLRVDLGRESARTHLAQNNQLIKICSRAKRKTNETEKYTTNV